MTVRAPLVDDEDAGATVVRDFVVEANGLPTDIAPAETIPPAGKSFAGPAPSPEAALFFAGAGIGLRHRNGLRRVNNRAN